MHKIRNLGHKSSSRTNFNNSNNSDASSANNKSGSDKNVTVASNGEDDKGVVGGGGGLGTGLFNKIKQYSAASNKLLRRNHKNLLRSHSPHRPHSGSYDMTGDSGKELKPEIGAPVLLTTTALDVEFREQNWMDNFQFASQRLSTSSSSSSCHSSDSSDFFAECTNFGSIKFSFPSAEQKQEKQELEQQPPQDQGNSCRLSSSTEGDYEVPPSPKSILNYSLELPRTVEEEFVIRPPARKQKSQSVANLHKTELKVFLSNPSMTATEMSTSARVEADDNDANARDKSSCSTNTCRNVNREEIAKKQTAPAFNDFKRSMADIIYAQHLSMVQQNPPVREDLYVNQEEVEKSSQSKNNNNNSSNNIQSTSTPHTSMTDQNRDDGRSPLTLAMEEEERDGKERYYCDGNDSLTSKNTTASEDDDFDMKSASYESLRASRHLFMSIDELNELTRQINADEDFKNPRAFEYCDHRSKLRPSERRITLMRNKKASVNLNLGEKREKLTNAWSGIKHWLDEEKGKFKETVQRHAAMQRVGAMANGNQHLNKRGGKGSQSDTEAGTAFEQQQDQQRAKNGGKAVSEDRDLPTVLSNILAKAKSSASVSTGGAGGSDAAAPVYNPTEGQNGFEELRRYVKQGGDFGKDLVAILQERVESEHIYSKSLSKMASKLNKTCREIPGSLAEAWRGVATELESRSEVHRQFSNSLTEEIVKPLKVILDNQHKARKSVENTVDKSARVLCDWRTTEAKVKKSSHAAARENEKLQDALHDVRISRSPSISILPIRNHHKSPEKEGNGTKNGEKDTKLDVKRRKAEDAVKRADVEYYTLCIRSERARVDWEMAVLRGSSVLQSLESQRLSHMKDYISAYLKLSTDMNPVLDRIVERLTPTITTCNVQKDIGVIKNIRRASEGPSEQLLPDFYCEHTTLAMNRERRKQALVKLLQLVRQDLERERKSRDGLRGISQQMNNADQQNVTDKLYHIRSMLTYLEGARYKLQSALLELDHKPRGSHPLAPHIQVTRDRHGLQQSILKVPLWLKNNENDGTTAAVNGHHRSEDQENLYDNAFLPEDGSSNGGCSDIRNDAAIKLYSKAYNRSKSSVELSSGSSRPNSETPSRRSVIIPNGNSTLANAGAQNGSGGKDSPTFDRGIADGGSNQHDSDFDEFSSHDETEHEEVRKKQAPTPPTSAPPQVLPDGLGRCRALYSYTPKMYDELELEPGDIINIHTKQVDGWWLGELKNRVGIFPATYVEEIS